jgi:2-polyprenyl-3-methyl-5-hydroxy-6-metoxy-1,4-benzoquinol methylase
MHSCHLCGASDLMFLIDFGNHPVSKHYLADRFGEQPTWPVRLFFCETCGLTQLVGSCPPEVLYDNYVTLSSWKAQPQVRHEIDIIERLDGMGPDSRIIEIGCNDGMFLEALSSAGYENLLGVEPSSDACDVAVAKGLDIVHEFLSPALSETITKRYGKFDLFISRQNLEHISHLKGVIESIGILLKPMGFVLIELPNYACNLRCQDYSLWEEHVNYFTMDTLRYFLSLADIELIHHEIILFSGEGIFVVGRKTSNVSPSLGYLADLRRQNVHYATRWPEFRRDIGAYLLAQKQAGKNIAIYGAGSRACCLVNFAGLASHIDVFVDDQPEKQNKFMPGSKLPIAPSDVLYTRHIDICLLAVNTENEDKVIGRHAKWVQQGGQFWSVFPPSDRLLPVWKFNGV